MALQVHLASLSILSVESFATYLALVIKKLVTSPEHTQQVCSHLETMVRGTIPPSQISDITRKLLGSVSHVYDELLAAEHLEETTAAVLSSILQPTVTRIEDVADKLHYTLLDRYYSLPTVVMQALGRLPNLQVLRVGRTALCRNLATMPATLLELYYRDCDDDALAAVSLTCKNLRSLDIRNSYVTNAGVESILRLQHLTDLNVEHTRITRSGLTRLLEGMAGNKLQSFACDNFTESHVQLLARSFPRLKSLTLTNYNNCSLLPLQQLASLSHLTLQHCSFSLASELLKVMGSRLQYLDLLDVDSIDMSAIAGLCPALQCLHIVVWNSADLGFPEGLSFAEYSQRCPIPEFPSVRCLVLVLENQVLAEHIVLHFKNLEKLYIPCFGSGVLFNHLIQQKLVPHLEELAYNIGVSSGVVVHFRDKQTSVVVLDFETRKKLEFNADPHLDTNVDLHRSVVEIVTNLRLKQCRDCTEVVAVLTGT